MKPSFYLNVVLPDEEACIQVIPTQTLSRVMSAIYQKYSLKLDWSLVMSHGFRKMSLEESLKNHSSLESMGLTKTKEIVIVPKN